MILLYHNYVIITIEIDLNNPYIFEDLVLYLPITLHYDLHGLIYIILIK